MGNNPKSDLELQVATAIDLQREVESKIQELKSAQAKIDETWKTVETVMIDNNIKNIKGEWGSITIAERLSFDVDETLLPKKFFKKVVDTRKLADAFRLEGKAPKGTEPRYSKYLTRRIK